MYYILFVAHCVTQYILIHSTLLSSSRPTSCHVLRKSDSIILLNCALAFYFSRVTPPTDAVRFVCLLGPPPTRIVPGVSTPSAPDAAPVGCHSLSPPNRGDAFDVSTP